LCRAPQVGSPEKYGTSGERRSRIRGPQLERESGDGMDAAELAASEHQLSFGNLGIRADHLQSPYESDNGDNRSETDV